MRYGLILAVLVLAFLVSLQGQAEATHGVAQVRAFVAVPSHVHSFVAPQAIVNDHCNLGVQQFREVRVAPVREVREVRVVRAAPVRVKEVRVQEVRRHDVEVVREVRVVEKSRRSFVGFLGR